MPKFNWEARTRTGGTQKGVIEAATVDAVEAQLKKYGFNQGSGFQAAEIRRWTKDKRKRSRCFYTAVFDHD